jgi:hypothetical protein
MGEQFRRMVDEELSGAQPPSVAGLIERAVRDGRRLRRQRAVRTGVAGGVAAVALATALTVGIGVAGNGPPDGASVSTSPVAPARATPAALLELMTSLLPPGRMADFAGHSDPGQIVAQLTLDTGNGPGTVRVTVEPRTTSPCVPFGPTPGAADPGDTSGPVTPGTVPSSPAIPLPCATVAVGTHTFDSGRNCASRRGADVLRPDGVSVTVVVGDCPAVGNGTKPGVLVLSTEQLARIAADPRWGVAMPGDLVAAGAHRFGDHLAPIPGVGPR